MLKKIVVLTKSDKLYHLCVSGIDLTTGEWVRLENPTLQYPACPVSKKDITYANGQECELLDVISVECLSKDNRVQCQPENIFIDSSARIAKVAEMTWQEVVLRWKLDRAAESILNSDAFLDGKIPADFMSNIHNKQSLQFVRVHNVIIQRSYNQFKMRYDLAASFDYVSCTNKTLHYSCVSVTDPEYRQIMSNNTLYLDKAYMIISLGDEYHGYHYMFVAKIIDDDAYNGYYWVTTSQTTGIKYWHKHSNCPFNRINSLKYTMDGIKNDCSIRKCKKCHK